MATVRQKLQKMLFERGLFEDQAATIVKATEADLVARKILVKFDDPEDSYPPPMVATLWMSVEREAGKWLDANMPNHWARAMFPKGEPDAPADVDTGT